MTDDLSIQQKRPSAIPYVLGGAAVGGATGYFGTPAIDATRKWVSEPGKYANSYEELVEEVNKADKFEAMIKDASEEEKTLLNKLKDANKTKEEAMANWQKEFDAFKEGKVPELPAENGLLKEKLDAENLIKELEAKGSTATEGAKTVEKNPLSILRKRTRTLSEAQEQVNTLKAQNAGSDAIKQAQERVKTLQGQVDDLYTQIVDNADYSKIQKELIDPNTGKSLGKVAEKEAVEKAKVQLRRDLKGHTQDYLQRLDDFNKTNPANKYLQFADDIAKEKSGVDEALTKLKEITRRDPNGLRDDVKGFNRYLQAAEKSEVQKLDGFKKILKGYENASQKSEPTKWEILKWFFGGKEPKAGDAAMKDFMASLTEKEKALLGDDIANAGTNLKKAIAECESRITTIKDSGRKVLSGRENISAIQHQIDNVKAHVVEQYGKGAYIDKTGKVMRGGKPVTHYIKDGKKVPIKHVEFKVPEFTTDFKLPEKISLTSTGEKVDVSKALESAKANLESINGKIAAERAKLAGAVDEKSLIEEFAKTKGSKEEAGKKAIESLKDDVKQLCEGKISNKKLAIAAGIAAAAGIGLALMFRPKAKEQA